MNQQNRSDGRTKSDRSISRDVRKCKIRKLMNTPSASSERMHPMVKVPIRRLMSVAFSLDLELRSDPARAADKFALLRPGCFAVVGKQVEYALQALRLE